MNFKFLMLFAVSFLFSFGKKEKKPALDDYYIIENSKDFQNLVYKSDYKTYRDILYTNVVFN